jgi:XTP/dITP diphosphohydrolase
VAEPGGRRLTAEGVCEGVIAFSPEGSYGFGYDPVFFLPQFRQTMAQLPPEVKNRISHRARAAQGIRPVLEKLAGRDHVSG